MLYSIGHMKHAKKDAKILGGFFSCSIASALVADLVIPGLITVSTFAVSTEDGTVRLGHLIEPEFKYTFKRIHCCLFDMLYDILLTMNAKRKT